MGRGSVWAVTALVALTCLMGYAGFDGTPKPMPAPVVAEALAVVQGTVIAEPAAQGKTAQHIGLLPEAGLDTAVARAQRPAPGWKKALQALTEGVPPEAWPAFVATVSTRDLEELFAKKTHMDLDWRIRNNLADDAALLELAKLWANPDELPGSEAVEGRISLGTKSRNRGNLLALVDDFYTSDRYIYAHYSVPDNYMPDSVIVRWVDMENRSMVHLDRHRLSTSTHELQEIWMRPSEGWSPGIYRVEVLSADEHLEPIAATLFEVRELNE